MATLDSDDLLAISNLLAAARVTLAPLQGPVVFNGQVKIQSSVANEGALHLEGPSTGYGLYTYGLSGQQNSGVLYGIESFGGTQGLSVDPQDPEITAIKAKTDNLPAAPAAVGSAMTLTSAYDAAKTTELPQLVRDALWLPPSVSNTPPPSGSIDAILEQKPDDAALAWVAAETAAGALAAHFDAHAWDTYNDQAATHSPTMFGAWSMVEFDGKLFVGLGDEPGSGRAGVVALVNADLSLTFEYSLPEEGVSSMQVTPDGLYLIVTGTDERANTGNGSSIYLRDTAGTWTRKPTLTGMPLHVWRLALSDDTIYVVGSNVNYFAKSTDLGDTWTYSGAATFESATRLMLDIVRLGTVLFTSSYYGSSPTYYWQLHRSADDGATWTLIDTQTMVLPDNSKQRLGNFALLPDRVVIVEESNRLLSIVADGTVSSIMLPFVTTGRYSNLAVLDGYLYALGASGVVWRTVANTDLATWTVYNQRQWEQVWRTSATGARRTSTNKLVALGTWGSNLVVSTNGTDAQLFVRPANPLTAKRHVTREAMLLAPIASAAIGSVDAALSVQVERSQLLLDNIGFVPSEDLGLYVKVYTLTVAGMPASGVYCRLATDSEGLLVVASGTTNRLGRVLFWHNLEAGTPVYIHADPDGYDPLVDEEVI